jgi:hypothetical protein
MMAWRQRASRGSGKEKKKFGEYYQPRKRLKAQQDTYIRVFIHRIRTNG